MLAFYALQTRWIRLDRFYKLYVGDRALHAAYLAAQVYDARSAELSSGGVGFLRGMAHRELARLEEREREYDAMDLSTQAFLTRDARNFTIARTEIRDVSLRVRVSAWLAGKGGVLTIETTGLSRTRLLLPPRQPDSALDALLTCPP